MRRSSGKFESVRFAAADGIVVRAIFTQAGLLVDSHYSGGTISSGRLIGRWTADGLIGAYVESRESGEVIAGTCRTLAWLGPSGDLFLVERWRRGSGDSGYSAMVEVTGSSPELKSINEFDAKNAFEEAEMKGQEYVEFPS